MALRSLYFQLDSRLWLEKKGASVLDVGCGQGFFSYLFRKHGMTVCGIDVSEVGIRAAQNAYGHLGISFVVADIETAIFPE